MKRADGLTLEKTLTTLRMIFCGWCSASGVARGPLYQYRDGAGKVTYRSGKFTYPDGWIYAGRSWWCPACLKQRERTLS